MKGKLGMERRSRARSAVLLLLILGTAAAGVPAQARRPDPGGEPHGRRFERVATFPVFTNNADPAATTVAEIIAATGDGTKLIYTDSLQSQIGFVDITDPEAPQPAGTIAVGGEPTSVAVHGGYALVGVDTSPSFVAPTGELAVVDLSIPSVVARLPMAGQPDSVKVSPDGRYAAVVIENERDEEVEVGGVEGGLPQLPGGLLQIVDLTGGTPAAWPVRSVGLSGLTEYAPTDPEPEFVDINRANQAVVTLQENNHLAVVDLARGEVVSHFPAGTVDLTSVDTVEDDAIRLTGSLAGVAREPDGVVWLDNNRFATANEGDLFGGSRGFSVFDRQGTLRYDSGNTVDHLAARHGHYPEARSENKGTEAEGVAFGRYQADGFLFVGSERGNFVAVYRVTGDRDPEFVQLLPTAIGPEGLLPIPGRDLFVATSEEDDPPFGVRTAISIYRLGDGPADYPQIVSDNGPEGTPIPWSALSGLAADPADPNVLRAVWDSFYVGDPRLFTLDVSTTPAVITGSTPITGGTGNYDFEGIATAPDGTTWLASEGDATDGRPNRLLQVDAAGAVLDEIGLPAEVLACRAASAARGSLGSGFEGLAVAPADGGYRVYVAQQRGWQYTTPGCEALDDDPADTTTAEPASTRIWVYDPAGRSWTHVPYELQPKPGNAAWVGLSEIVLLPDADFGFIERDNLSGPFAELKWLVKADVAGGVTRAEKESYDLLPGLAASKGWFSDKPEGFTVAADGSAYVVTDNDGVDGSTGETLLLRPGGWQALFGG